ncbi:MAG: CPBP family intramembrane metalloprotease [Clostridia bacterium]|nr:CPBP family intramembrane metalloprotease [Clostridia bacterium]
MTKLYEKNETAFAVMWILIYIIGTCLAEALSEIAGIFKLFPAIFHAGLAAFILVWVKRNGLSEKYGLFLPRYRLSQAWFFLPLALVAIYKVIFSPALRYAPVESILFVVSMLCVGFLEEMIFRGFLFRAMEKKNLTRAVVISAVTFGIGHIVNLINGQDLLETCGQIVFAVIVGFALVILFYKGRSLVPCIVFHSVFNSLSVISNENAQMRAFGGPVAATTILVGASVVLLGVYTIWNRKHLKG